MHLSGRQVGENRRTEPGFRGESPWRSAARVRSSSKARLIQWIKAVCARQRARRADFLEPRQEIADNWSQLSVADITYIAIATRFVYLGAILDARLRRVVDYAIGKRIDARWRLPHSGPPSRRADRHRGHPSLRPRFAVRCRRLLRPHASLPRFIEEVYKAKIGRSDARFPSSLTCLPIFGPIVAGKFQFMELGPSLCRRVVAQPLACYQNNVSGGHQRARCNGSTSPHRVDLELTSPLPLLPTTA
jgi:hypothetical protein